MQVKHVHFPSCAGKAASQTCRRRSGVLTRAGAVEDDTRNRPPQFITRTWKFLFKPGNLWTDRFGVAIPIIGGVKERSEADQREAIERASRELTSIDDDERRRRLVLGTVLMVATVLGGIYQVKVGSGFAPRLGLAVVAWIGMAEYMSGVTGL